MTAPLDLNISDQAAFYIVLAGLWTFVAVAMIHEAIKTRRLDRDLAAANTRADLESDEFRTSADEAMAQGNDHGRVWDRWSA